MTLKQSMYLEAKDSPITLCQKTSFKDSFTTFKDNDVFWYNDSDGSTKCIMRKQGEYKFFRNGSGIEIK